MQTKEINVRSKMPFTVHDKQQIDYDMYLQAAQDHLVDTINNYSLLFGKSEVD